MATTYDVHFGPTGSMSQIATGQAGTSIEVPYDLEYSTEYSWRVDSVNDGTTTGDTWTFTTAALAPPLPGGGGGGGGSDPNSMITFRRIVAAADNTIWYEDI